MKTSIRILALLAPGVLACGAVVDNNTRSDGSADADCHYTTVHNDPQCPVFFYYGDHGPCSPVGLTCLYPGAGDGTSRGCASTAGLSCYSPDDGGVDGGSGHWLSNQ